MAHEQQPLEAMEEDYDSDGTELLELTIEDENEEENEEGSRTSSTQALDIDVVGSPELSRRRIAAPLTAGPSAAAAAAAQYLRNNQSEEDEENNSSSSSSSPHNYLMDELEDPPLFSSTEATQAPAVEAPQPQHETQHSSSSSQVLDGAPPSPAPPPEALDDSHGRQQQEETTPPFSSQPPQTRTPAGISEGAGASASSSVAASVSNLDEVVNPPGVAGSSSTLFFLTSTPSKIFAEVIEGGGSPENESESKMCPICFEPWTNMGDHRLSCLKCGHLYGFHCISKWLQGSTKKNKGRCPQCNAMASKEDIRFIYAKTYKVPDTNEKERIMKELNKMREENRRLEVELDQIKLIYELKSQQVVKLQEELKSLKASACRGGVPPTKDGQSSSSVKKVIMFREWLELCREGGCRVMAHNEWLGMLVVSMTSQVRIFPGFGVKKINLLDLRVDRYLPLHQKQIRDLAFNPAKHDLLLSVGMDRMAKITNICSNTPVGHFIASAPLWCCSWSTTEVTVFYVGTTLGQLHKYDTRTTSGPMATINLPGSGPAVSMAYIQPGPESSLTWGSLVVAQLKACFLVEVEMPQEVEIHRLPLDGAFTSVSCEAATCHVLVSSRPSQQHPHARHAVCLLQQVTAGPGEGRPDRRTVTAQPVHIFQGGTSQRMLSRSLLAEPPFPDSSPLVYASDESTQGIYVWELGSQNCLQHLRYSETVVDLLQVRMREEAHLVALTEKGVRIYRWLNRDFD